MTVAHEERRAQALAALGLPPDAPPERVRRAFRRLAFTCHPDLHGGRRAMERRFQALVEAYRTALEGARPPEEPPRGPLRGRDLHFRLELDFLQAAAGAEVPIRFPRPVLCPRCRGEEGLRCSRCGGAREVEERAVMRIRIPAGVDGGEVVRLRRAGGEGRRGGGAGDLYLLLRCREHPVLRRRGLDVHSEVEVEPGRLRAGGSVRVQTIHGFRTLPLPPMTRPGKVFQLSGQGIARRRGGEAEAGHHFVRIAERRPAAAREEGGAGRAEP